MDPERLAALPLFADVEEADRGEVARCTHEVSVAAGETVAPQGDNAYEFFVIESGEADVRRGDGVIASVGAGDVIGEMGLLVTGTRTASIVATSPMILVARFTREFRRIEDRVPAIAERLRATMRERVASSAAQRQMRGDHEDRDPPADREPAA